MYTFVDNPELNTEQIKTSLLKDGGLCPCCDKKIKENASLASFTNDHGVYYYLICNKCLNMLNKLTNELVNKKKSQIEIRLDKNIHIYAATLLKSESFLEEEDKYISVLNNNNAPWVLDDKKYFKENENSKFRYRKIFFGELEETYNNKEHLKEDAKNKSIEYVIVHNVGNGQTVKSFINDLSGQYPVEDEDFIAALFIILIQKIEPSKIMDIYKDIKERKIIFKDLNGLRPNF
jgi:hypothetical protein